MKPIAWFAVAVGLVAAVDARAASHHTNLVLILTDNHSAWTLGCYGNRDIRTPHIDRLAREGLRFTRCYSSNAVCSPTRATLLTGLIPSQHGVHCFLGGGDAQMGPKAYDTIGEFRTLPKILAEAGYACGLSGKWHLGGNLHPQEGFSYWVTMPHGGTTEFYNAEVIENEQLRREPGYLTDFWTNHAVRFLEQNRDRPFFLYLAYNGPYGLGKLLLDPGHNRHVAYYADKELKSFPREEPHPWLFNNREYINNPVSMRRYAAEVSGVDDGVGRILATLAGLGLDQNTLVVFTGDQGLAGGHHGVWGMGDHTRPLCTFDQGIHVPLIFRQPGAIAPGGISSLMVSNYDFLPTLLTFLGLGAKIPREENLPGRDYSGVLRGRPLEWENVIYYEFENSRMVRTDRWKYTRRFPSGPDELYNLVSDPGEQTNLVGRPEHAATQREVSARLDAFFNRYAVPKYDLWHGGRSKSLLLTMPEKGAQQRAK